MSLSMKPANSRNVLAYVKFQKIPVVKFCHSSVKCDYILIIHNKHILYFYNFFIKTKKNTFIFYKRDSAAIDISGGISESPRNRVLSSTISKRGPYSQKQELKGEDRDGYQQRFKKTHADVFFPRDAVLLHGGRVGCSIIREFLRLDMS